MTQLITEGFEVVTVGMSFSHLNSASKLLETIILKHMINHGGHHVLQWCASNVAIDTDASERIMPSKKRSNERIDCIVAVIIALAVLMLADEIKESMYETQGIRSV